VLLDYQNYEAIQNLMCTIQKSGNTQDALSTIKGLLERSPADPQLQAIAQRVIDAVKNGSLLAMADDVPITGVALDGDGERVDILYSGNIAFNQLDMYQKSHYRRYEFAKDLLQPGSCCGDFACGTGYGSVMLAEKAAKVIGADINSKVIEAIQQRYQTIRQVEFIQANLLDLQYQSFFDTIISFETMEHLAENDIPQLLNIYYKALKSRGRIIFSVPYMQERSEAAINLGFHLTFSINESKIETWLKNANFKVVSYKYQNYETHTIQDNLSKKDFIICVAQKQNYKDINTTDGYISKLEQERETHIEEITNLRKHIDLINAEIGKHIFLPKNGLTYAQDLLYTFHNADFMKNPLFSQTYALVKQIDNGQFLKNDDIQWRMHVLCWAAFHAKNLEGDFVDCGVSTGLFARGVINYVDFQKLNKTYYLLDTFSGMDPRYSSPYEMQRNETLGYSKNTDVFEKVKETFSGFNVEIIKGAIPDTLSQVRTEKICYLSVDMNCVMPEIAALEFFWNKIVSGGVIILDDYGYPGHIEQKNAHDAFAKSKNVQVLSLPTCQGMIIKPYSNKQVRDISVTNVENKTEKPFPLMAIGSGNDHKGGNPSAPDDVDEKVNFDLQSIYKGHHQVTYRGINALRCPFDYVIYQMIVTEIRPDLIIEIGTNMGGGALYLADLLDNIDHGVVHTIDIKKQSDRIISQHPRIRLFTDGWENYDTEQAKQFSKVLVIEDSSHTYENTLRVLHKFASVVTPESYFIVEDGIINELGMENDYNGGPLRAVREFLVSTKEFEIDRRWCDFFGENATFNVNGYLKKKKGNLPHKTTCCAQTVVSIAIPCYEMHGRGVEFLDCSLTKISQQTYKNIEVIISDHSQDDSIEHLCNKWKSFLNIKYFRNENKRGNSSANMNNALIHCDGDLIKILFQDDFLLSETSIEEIVDAFTRNPHSNWLITACEHSNDGVTFYRPFYPQYDDNIHLGNNTISSPSVLTIRRKDVLLFDENLIWLMDCDYYKSLYVKFGSPSILNKINVVTRTWNCQVSNFVSDGIKTKEYNYVKEKYEKIHLPLVPEVKITEEVHKLSEPLKRLKQSKAPYNLADRNLSKIRGVIFSKDRSMQLDGALRSFSHHCTDAGAVVLNVLYTTSSALHANQYQILKAEYPSVHFVRENSFKDDLLALISSSEYILFLVDDNIFVKGFSIDHAMSGLKQHPEAIGFSLRLGSNTRYCYMLTRGQAIPEFKKSANNVNRYEWTTAECDFGYPLEVSSSIYRAADIVPLLQQLDYKNPNTLELALDSSKHAFLKTRKSLLCFGQSVTFCNPLNMVQTMWKNRAGGNSLYTPAKLAEMYDEGYRMDIGAFTGFKPDSCHLETEVPFIRTEEKTSLPVSVTVSIIILNYNGLDHLRLCLDSIKKNTPEKHEIIVVDNASTDGSLEYLRSIPDLILIENQTNIGCPPARAQAMTLAQGHYVILLDNDTVVTPKWITKFINCSQSDSQIGLIGPRSNYVSGPQIVQNAAYGNVDEMEAFAQKWAQQHMNQYTPSHRLVGFCMFITRAVIDKIGSVDASFGKFGFEDDDYTWRAQIAGFIAAIAHDVFIHHAGGPQGNGNQAYNKQLLDAWGIFRSKWGLPQELQYGAAYDVSAILSQPFDATKHYVPLADKAIVEKLTSTHQKKLAHEAIGEAASLFEMERTGDAIEAIMTGISRAPNEPSLYWFLAERLINLGRFSDAVESLQALPAIAQQHPTTLALLGYAKEGLGFDAEAELLANSALSITASSARALALKGKLAMKIGDSEVAKSYYSKASKADATWGLSFTRLGTLLSVEGKQKESLELFEQGFLCSADITDCVVAYHTAIIAVGEFARGTTAFQKALAAHPKNRKIRFLLIDLFLKQKKYQEAMKEIEDAIIVFGLNDGIEAAALEVRKQIGPKEIRSDAKRGTLSVCMIVKNEEQHIARSLHSLSPVADELLVVDTGSTDKTADIARIFGAKIFDFTWTGNFADARNFSLSKASGHWILVHDADEVLSMRDHAVLTAMLRKKKPGAKAYSVLTRNYTLNQPEGWVANVGEYPEEEAGTGWVPTTKVRLFMNDPRVRFEGHVHECVEPSLLAAGLKIKTFDVPIHHYGRLNVGKTMAKANEYYHLGIKKLEEGGEYPRALRELAIQAGELGKHKEAIELWTRLINLKVTDETLITALFNTGSCYFLLGKYEDSLATSKRVMKLAPRMKENILTYACNELCIGDVQKAIIALTEIAEQGPGYPPALAALMVAHIINGTKEEGFACINKLYGMRVNVNEYLYAFAQYMIKAERIENAAILLEAAIETGLLHQDTHALLAECRGRLATGNASARLVAQQNE
jgi:glycosyltransferase involved in cell wall biosynthesis/cephalosporin hydroxylase/tetratricopeptide (TPR) repeat protein/cyclopropane fatty-acyl-phospholipid synthase-like methyltransferase